MKVLKFLAVGAVAGFMFASCGSSTQPLIEGVTKAEVDSVSYAVGTSFGQMIKGSNIEGLDYSKVMEAMKDVVNGKEPKIDAQQAGVVINTYMGKVQDAIAKRFASLSQSLI